MLGQWDRNDPTPPIRLLPSRAVRGLLGPFVGLAWIVFGALRIGSSFWDGVLFLVGGLVFVGTGAANLIAGRRAAVSRRAPARGTGGGTGSRP